MNIEDFTVEVKEYEKNWNDDNCPDYVVEEYVLEYLPKIPYSDYDLKNVLSKRTISLLLEEGSKIINSKSRGGRVTQIREGKTVDLSYLEPLYKRLFEQWMAAGWLERKKDPESDAALILKI